MAVLGVAVFQFGAGIAIERGYAVGGVRADPSGRHRPRAWQPASQRQSASPSRRRRCSSPPRSSRPTCRCRRRAGSRCCTALTLGAVPFSLLGIALGYWAPPRAAVPIANLIFLPLVVLGGLWTGGQYLPSRLDAVSRALPTRPWAEIVWAAAEGGSWPRWAPAALGAWTFAFGLLALWGYRRDEGERFR